MRKIIYILVLLHFSFANANITIRKVSEKITKCESSLLYQVDKFQKKRYGKLRQELDFIKLLNVNLQNDTVFILESYSLSNLNLSMYITFWNSRKQFSFTKKNINPNYVIYDQMPLYAVKERCYPFFTKYMVQLVNEWNIDELKRGAKINGTTSDALYIAVRIVFKNKKYTVQCASFKDFFDL